MHNDAYTVYIYIYIYNIHRNIYMYEYICIYIYIIYIVFDRVELVATTLTLQFHGSAEDELLGL